MRNIRLANLPEDWLAKSAFEVDGRNFVFRQVLQAAEIRGGMRPFLERSLLACRFYTQAQSMGTALDGSLVESNIEAFRYNRDLVSAEETERWLTDQGLSTADFRGFFERQYWLEKGHRENVPDVEVEESVFTKAWVTDLMLSGQLRQFARQLASEVVCGLGKSELGDGEKVRLVTHFKTAHGLDESRWDRWLADWSLDPATTAWILRWQELYRERQREVLSAVAREQLLEENRIGLTRVALDVVGFDSESTAKEGYSCVISDGLTLEQVSRESGYPLEHRESFLRDLPEELRTLIMSAYPGAVLRPFSSGGTFDVYRVVKLNEARLEDPAVATILDALLIQRHFGDVEAREVRWRLDETGAA